MDPDEFLRAYGAAAFQGVLDKALPLVEMFWLRSVRDRDLSTPESRAGLEAEVLKWVDGIRDPLTRKHYRAEMTRRLANLFGTAKVARRGENIVSLAGRSRLAQGPADREPGLGPVLRAVVPVVDDRKPDTVIVHPFRREQS